MITVMSNNKQSQLIYDTYNLQFFVEWEFLQCNVNVSTTTKNILISLYDWYKLKFVEDWQFLQCIPHQLSDGAKA